MSSQLTSEQLRAVTFLSDKNLVIEAGAGAGKTKVLSERVKWLLTQAPVSSRLNSSQVFIVTFTNDAQKELQERIQTVLPYEYTSMLHISTIDALFDSLVDSLFPLWWEKKQHLQSEFLQIPPILTLVSEKEVQRNLEKKVSVFFNENQFSQKELALVIDFILSGGFKKNHSSIFSPTNTLENILKCMCQDQFLASKKENIRIISSKIHPVTVNLISQIHDLARAEYEKRIQKGEFTYADKTVFLKENLQNNSPIFVKELIVDEYQDTNFIQHEILCQLVLNSKGRMVVVGDPKQSIYGFRGASVNVFKSLLENKEWEHIVLNKNFRTQETLLHEINTLSNIAFDWKNPRLPLEYKESFFFEEAQKKYIGENALVSGLNSTLHDATNSTCVYMVSASVPSSKGTGSSEAKLSTHAPLAYAHFLKQLKEKENINWKDIVVLCEKNKQIKILKDAFLQFEIPVKTDENSHNSLQEKIEDFVSLALVKCLAGKADSFDYYLVLTSPLVDIPEHELYDEKSVTRNEFLSTLEIFQKIARDNFFLAWQKLRWFLVEKRTNNAKLFCANMDFFAKALFAELSNSNTRVNLEKLITIANEKSFVLPDTLSYYNIVRKNYSQEHDGDAIEIKTIHKAKGLEWPYVCFYPKYGMQMQTGEFIASQSQNYLDISWLSQDVESLSVVQRIENTHFLSADSLVDEKNKTVRFSELRKQQEENYERQRVFYTAFTRPQKKLILLQPTFHHSSKKGIKELSQEKKSSLYNDYLEQDVYTKYFNLKFNIPQSKKNMEDLPLKEVFSSEDNKIELTHYNLNTFCAENTFNQIEQKMDFDSNLILVKKRDSENKLLRKVDNLSKNISDILQQKKEQRLKIHKGNLFHARMENMKINRRSLIFQLEKKAHLCKREFEIWSKNNNYEQSKRNIVDMLLLFHKGVFEEIMSSLDTPTNDFCMNGEVALVIDFKTGQPQQEHVEQITNYINLINNFWEECSERQQNFAGVGNMTVLGAIVYTKQKSQQNLSFHNEFIEPFYSSEEEKFYLFNNNFENMPKNRHSLLTT
ncbi:MAG: UvrD-helicase domain-containing protein [Bdellovibrionota bacterium]